MGIILCMILNRRHEITADFVDRVSRGDVEAVELETMLLTRRPEEIFAAEIAEIGKIG